MKITKTQLKQIIKEEIGKTLREASEDSRVNELAAELSNVLEVPYEKLLAQVKSLVDETSPQISVQPGPDDTMDDDEYEMEM